MYPGNLLLPLPPQPPPPQQPWPRCAAPAPRERRHLPLLAASPALATRTNVFFSSQAKSLPLDQTLRLLHLLPARDTVTWNIALSACVRHRRYDSAFRLFLDMLGSSPPPDSVTLRALFRAASGAGDLRLLLQLHAVLRKLGRRRFSASEMTVLNTCLLNSYFKLGSVELARSLLGEMPERDVVAYASILAGYVESGRHVEALRSFRDMVERGECTPNEHVFSSALRACSGVPCLFEGRQIHATAVKLGIQSDVFVGTGLVDLYVKCSEMDCAKRAFSEISEPTVVSWNALMAGCLDGEEVLHLLCRMRSTDVIPDYFTFANVLRACREGATLQEVQQLHCLIVKTMKIELDVFVSGALFEVYLDHGYSYQAQRIFSDMEEKDDAAYNVAIQAYIRNGLASEAVNLCSESVKMGKELREATAECLLKDVELFVGKQLHAILVKFGSILHSCTPILMPLIGMYAEHQLFSDALGLFGRIPRPDLIMWTSLISKFAHCGENRFALDLFVRMLTEDSVEPPNCYTFSSLLSSCAHIAALDEGRQIHAQVIKSNNDVNYDSFILNSLFCMYAKCGCIDEANRIWTEIRDPDVPSWNAKISSLGQHGFAERAIETFEELLNQKDTEPNHTTYIAVLTACSRSGMLEKGYQYFKSIKQPAIEHYACLVDLFGRAGKLKEAIQFIKEMPFEANEYVWSSLLAASCTHRNIALGEYSAQQLLKLNPSDPGTYISLSNMYASAGRWDDVKHVRKLMKSQAESKQPGISWLRVKTKNYAFFADSRSCKPSS